MISAQAEDGEEIQRLWIPYYIVCHFSQTATRVWNHSLTTQERWTGWELNRFLYCKTSQSLLKYWCATWVFNNQRTASVHLGTKFFFRGVYPWNICWEILISWYSLLNKNLHFYSVQTLSSVGKNSANDRDEVSICTNHRDKRFSNDKKKSSGTSKHSEPISLV